MISHLQGKIILKQPNLIILDVNGVGYEVFVSHGTLEKLPAKNQELGLFCHLDVGERSLKFYGFLAFPELEMFRLVRGISGVGPKAALEISSLGSVDKIREMVAKGQTQALENIPGIGAKKARKIILELSGKLTAPDSKPRPSPGQGGPDPSPDDEVVAALTNLGFPKDRIKQTLSQLTGVTPPSIDGGVTPVNVKQNTEDRLKQALKLLQN